MSWKSLIKKNGKKALKGVKTGGLWLIKGLANESMKIAEEITSTGNRRSRRRGRRRFDRFSRGDRTNREKNKENGVEKLPKWLSKEEDGRVPFGTNVSSILNQKIYFPLNDWVHKIVYGATGVGKSTWAEQYVINKEEGGVCFIDIAKGEHIDNILRCLSEERLEKTVVLDHSDKDYPLPVGSFSSGGSIFQNDMIVGQWENFFIHNFGIKDLFQTRRLIAYSCKALFGLEDATLYDAVRVARDDDFRDRALSKLDRWEYKDVKRFWNDFDNMEDMQQFNYIKAFMNRAEVMFRDTLIQTTLGQVPKEDLQYKKWMDEGYTVLIKVPETHLPSEAVRIISALHVISFWQAALGRKSERNPRQFTVIADEPQTWLSDNEKTLDSIFSKARKYGLNMMCLFQSMQQIKRESSTLLKIMLDNEPDVIAFSETDIFKTRFNAYGLDWEEGLNEYQFYAKLRNTGVFKAQSMPLAESKRSQKEVEGILRKSREKYNKHYREVLKNIEKRGGDLWEEEEVNMKGKKSELQKNGIKTSVSTESNQEIEKSSNSSVVFE